MRTKTKSKERSEASLAILKYIKSLLISLIITFACIILFAFIIKWSSLPDSVISPVNLVIKGVSVFVGALVLTKSSTKGIVKGLIFSVIYSLVSFSVFSILAGEFILGLGLVADFAFTAVVGAIAGIIGVNIKKKA